MDHVLTVLCAEHRPPQMQRVEAMAQVRYTDAAGLPSALKGAESLFVWDFVSTAVADAWPSADRLRWIHIASAGVDRLLFPDLVGSSVVVTNSRGIFDRPIEPVPITSAHWVSIRWVSRCCQEPSR